MRKIKIANKKKFFSSLIIIISLLSMIFSFSVNAVNANKSMLTEKEKNILNEYEQVKVYVRKGQTAWHIQKKLAPNSDTRKLLYYCETINNRSMGRVEAGETVIFLKERD